MYLKRIDISGFKSFANRTELAFVPGITAVVGPNGSGKSNVTDAIRWVLGEQSAKSLRGTKMEDVIFAGSDSRKPVSFCEVTITFDNNTRKLPLDYTEVSVSRRVYRSGESEYRINQKTCRLRDVHELFMDTGIGKEAYSMIGQGRIEEILSNQSEERRQIFEEAAGIVKYKSRKKEAEKKLERTEENLERIQDIIHELQEQIRPLEEQAKKAEQYKEWQSELKQIDLSLYVYNIENVHQKWEQMRAQVQAYKNQQVVQSGQLSQYEAKLAQRQQELDEWQREWEKMQAQFLQMSEKVKQFEGELQLTIEKKKNQAENQQQLKKREEEIEGEQQKLQLDWKTLTQRLADKIETCSEAKRKLDDFLVQRSQLSIENKDMMKDLLHQEQKWIQRLAQYEKEQQFTQQELDALSERRKQVETESGQLEQQHIQQAQQKEGYQQKLEQIQAHIIEAQEKVRTTSELRASNQIHSEQYDQQMRNLEGEWNRTRSERKVLQEMHFFRGVQEVLQAKELTGICGAVAQLIQVPTRYEAALETALGSALQHIVVEDERSGREAIAFLKKRGLGRATFLPLDLLQARSIPERERLLIQGMDGVMGVANELVTCADRYQPLCDHLLGAILIVESLSVASQVAKKLRYRFRVVTIDGDVIHTGGSMSGGARKKNNLLERSRQIEQLKIRLQKLEKQREEKNSQIQQVEQQRAKLEDQWERLRTEGEQYRLQEQQLQSQLRELASQEQVLLEGKKRLYHEQNRIEEKEERLQAKLNEVVSELMIAHQSLSTIQTRIEEEQRNQEQKGSEKEQLHQQITEWRVKHARLEQEKSHLEENQQRLREEENRLLQQLKLVKIEQQQLKQLKENDHETAAQLRLQVESEQKKKTELEQRMAESKRKQESLLEEQTAWAHQAQELRQTVKNCESALHEEEVHVNRLDVELNHLLQKLADEYETSYEGARDRVGLPEDPQQAEKEARRYKQRIRSLGEVHLGAIEEHQRMLTRLEFLQTQETDLQTAKQSLYSMISEMETEMGQLFLERFEQIRQEFQEVFTQMFAGGTADLSLTDPENLLETGIDIVAQPPGKRPSQLSLLSGGERSLAAIALLFAVLQVKPVPFCILDEVDAALDEVNLIRFTGYLHRFSKETQFVIITHRKHTMEEADVLYGITMQESGVSRLVSMRLEDYDRKKELATT